MNKLIVTLFLLAITAGTGSSANAEAVPVAEPEFTEYVAQAARNRVGESPVLVKGTLTLSMGGFQMNLDRIYRFCVSNSEKCNVTIDQYIDGVIEVQKQLNMPVEVKSVMLILRSSDYISRVQASLHGEGSLIQMKPFVEGLVLVAALDTPRTTRPLSERDAKKLNLTQDQLIDLGSQNLAASLKPLSERTKPVKSGQIGSITGSIFEVSRIALHSQWETLAKEQGGKLLVSLPTTDLVLFVADDSPTAIDALRTLSNNVASKSPNPLNPKIVLRWDSDGWKIEK